MKNINISKKGLRILEKIKSNPGISQPEIVHFFHDEYLNLGSARSGISMILKKLEQHDLIYKKTVLNDKSGGLEKNLWYPK